jgi:uncharacterized protein YhaN
MRLSRLNLTRYGKFTGFFVDFGAKAPGKPDFHVIFGPNEAGKTTTLTAYLDLLFGIEKNSSYNFIPCLSVFYPHLPLMGCCHVPE